VSVLLEALKKAAEEKKKKGSDGDSSMNVGKESIESELNKNLENSLGFSLSSESSTESSQKGSLLESENEEKPRLKGNNTDSLILKLKPKESEVEHSDLLDIDEEESTLPTPPSVTLKATEVELDSDFDSKRTPEEIEEFISPSFLKDDRAPTPEPTKQKPALQISENDEDLLAEATASFDEEVLSVPDSKLSSNEIKIDEPVKQPSPPNTASLDTTIATEPFTDPVEKLPESNLERKEDVEDSYKWSMNDLPGYEDIKSSQKVLQPEIDSSTMDQSAIDEQSLANNPVLTKGENRRLNLVSKKRATLNPKFLIYVGVLGLFIGLFFYAILYYQDQSQALEDSFKKYQITRIEPSAALLAKTQKTLPAGDQSVEPKQNISASNKVKTISENERIVESSVDSANDTLSDKPKVNTLDVTNDLDSKEEATVDSANKTDSVLAVNDEKLVSSRNNVQKLEKSSLNKTEKVLKAEPAKPAIIQKTKGLSPEKLKLKAAYQAYQQKKWALSELFFREVVALNSEHTNAQLGLAGSLLNQQKFKESLDVYYQVLDSSPNNLYAIEGIASIMQQFPSQNTQWQDTLSQVLKDYPDSALLKSAMGNIFAQQNNWQEAQNYYFDALALEPTNAMYNYNLAISLDYLKQYASAIEYYTKALLYKTNQTNFDEVVIKTRLAALKLFMEKGDY